MSLLPKVAGPYWLADVARGALVIVAALRGRAATAINVRVEISPRIDMIQSAPVIPNPVIIKARQNGDIAEATCRAEDNQPSRAP